MLQCLELVYERKSSKEIALILTTPEHRIVESTVSGYIADAVRLLGARNRKDAAEQLFLSRHAPPQKPTPDILRVAGAVAFPATNGELQAGTQRLGLPFRTKGVTTNELGIRKRLIWILVIAGGTALSLGALASAVRLVNDIVSRHL